MGDSKRRVLRGRGDEWGENARDVGGGAANQGGRRDVQGTGRRLSRDIRLLLWQVSGAMAGINNVPVVDDLVKTMFRGRVDYWNSCIHLF